MSTENTIEELHIKIPNKGRFTNRTHQIDKHVGGRIRERRTMLGLTQQQLADLIGVTYQQAHKYERGINRVSAGRLYEVGQVLGVHVTFFYEGLDTNTEFVVNDRQRLCLELARNFSLIGNSKHQEALTQLARALAQETVEEDAKHLVSSLSKRAPKLKADILIQ
jgi:transcriptional regulator with XRE-family HTH domain